MATPMPPSIDWFLLFWGFPFHFIRQLRETWKRMRNGIRMLCRPNCISATTVALYVSWAHALPTVPCLQYITDCFAFCHIFKKHTHKWAFWQKCHALANMRDPSISKKLLHGNRNCHNIDLYKGLLITLSNRIVSLHSFTVTVIWYIYKFCNTFLMYNILYLQSMKCSQ